MYEATSSKYVWAVPQGQKFEIPKTQTCSPFKPGFCIGIAVFGLKSTFIWRVFWAFSSLSFDGKSYSKFLRVHLNPEIQFFYEVPPARLTSISRSQFQAKSQGPPHRVEISKSLKSQPVRIFACSCIWLAITFV